MFKIIFGVFYETLSLFRIIIIIFDPGVPLNTTLLNAFYVCIFQMEYADY